MIECEIFIFFSRIKKRSRNNCEFGDGITTFTFLYCLGKKIILVQDLIYLISIEIFIFFRFK